LSSYPDITGRSFADGNDDIVGKAERVVGIVPKGGKPRFSQGKSSQTVIRSCPEGVGFLLVVDGLDQIVG
jgi:hypothetical protein